MSLITISAFFATYIVRGNIVTSLHAFGDSSVGFPLLLFIAFFFALAAWLALASPFRGAALSDPFSREGLLACVAWVLLTLGAMIVLATTWPVISRLWSAQSVGLGAAFYNKACLPLFTLLGLMLTACPWIGWKGGIAYTFQAGAAAVLFMGALAAFAVMGVTKPLALVSAAAATGILASLCLLFAARPQLLRLPRALAAHGVHLGFALMLLGVAFSGPYKFEREMLLAQGESVALGDFSIQLERITQGDSFDHDLHPDEAKKARQESSPRYIYVETLLKASRAGQAVGSIRPEARIFAKRPDKLFLESDTLFTLGNELYATLHGLDGSGNKANLTLSLNPLVNWIWLGGILISLFPFLGMLRRGRSED
jgi:cytochrome c-type biogenesis protein CcmF